MRDRRRAMSSKQQDEAAQGVLKTIKEQKVLKSARRVAIYFANDGEINPLEMPKLFSNRRRKWYLPRLRKSGKRIMDFALFTKETTMVANKFGISEPFSENCEHEPPSKMDIIFMPLVSFDRSGNRLGMGGGYYDSTLAEANRGGFSDTLLIGLAHHFQEKRRLRSRSWDIKLDMIITDRELICVKPK